MSKEICTISIGEFDSLYTFYEDGRIKKFNDSKNFALNITSWITSKNINIETKKKLIEKCPAEHKKEIRQLLS